VLAEKFIFMGILAYFFAFRTAYRNGRFDSFIKSIKQG